MALKPTPIKISDSVSRILSRFSESRTLPIRQVERAKVFLLCSKGWNNLQISYQVSIRQDAISKWRNRFFQGIPLLQQVEETDPEHLEAQISALLADSPRPGQPATFNDEQIIKILEVACRNPEEYGFESSHWSLNQLANAVVKEGIVESISAKTISRFLKYGENPPPSRPLLVAFLRKNGTPGNIHRESQ